MSNFLFIQHSWPQLYEDAYTAEQNALINPRFTGVLCRSVLEVAINWIYTNDPDLELPYDTKLASLMHHEDFKNILKPSLNRELDLIRKTGNLAAHGKRISQHQALSSLKVLFRFLAFLSKYYSEEDPTIPEFDENQIPTGKEEKGNQAELLAKIVELEKQLTQQQEERKALQEKAENDDELRKKIQQEQEQVKLRKDNRITALGTAELTPDLLSEAETRELYIDILLQEAGWDPHGPNVREYPVKGMPAATNPSGTGKVDYVLWGSNGLPLGVIEAKRTLISAEAGQKQAEEYADCLESMTGQRPIIFYTNGFEHHLWDDTFYPPREVQGFYTADELQLLIDRRTERADIRNYPINKSIAGRPYQYEAIKRVASHFVTRNNQGSLKGKQRKSLLVMATGTGKTRTAIALVDVLTKCNWAKRVLFLADRNALVTQAKRNFNEHLPHLTAIDLTKESEDDGTRLVFSTYPTIMNKIDGLRSGDSRFYGVGHFDLVIIDEAHRSVYAKYGAIFEYFDSLLVGLTATPKKEIDHNTYGLFDIEEDNPTFAYELETAVNEKYLVPPKKAESVPIKFPRDGIKYNKLSEQDKRQYELVFGDPTKGEAPGEIDSKALHQWLFNDNTVDVVLKYIMQNGVKVGGEHIGKTIIFAANHKHAKFIEKRFNKLYPEYLGKMLRVIDNYEKRAENLLDAFCDEEEDLNPIIAVSVDMMDTGVDAPRVVNLVFFKRVKSATKFWQMIGRGTRLKPDLFGPGENKEHFFIFDFCENLEYFDENPEGEVPSPIASLTEQTFIAKLEIAQILAQDKFEQEDLKALRAQFLDQLHTQIASLNHNRFMVRAEMKYVSLYSDRSRWEDLTNLDVTSIVRHLAKLPEVTTGGDEFAKRFDLMMLNLIKFTLLQDKRQEYGKSTLISIGNALLKKQSIPAIAKNSSIIEEFMEGDFWKEPSSSRLEEMRMAIRDLIKFLDKQNINPVYTNFQDLLDTKKVKEFDVLGMATNLQSYKDRVENFIRKNRNYLAIDKLYTNKPLTIAELEAFEDFLFDGTERGTKEKFQKEYDNQPLGAFVRSIIGLDSVAVQQAFADFLHSGNLNPNQIKFIDVLIQFLTTNGVIDKTLLIEPPFTDLHDQGPFGLFEDDQAIKVISIVDQINENAGVA